MMSRSQILKIQVYSIITNRLLILEPYISLIEPIKSAATNNDDSYESEDETYEDMETMVDNSNADKLRAQVIRCLFKLRMIVIIAYNY